MRLACRLKAKMIRWSVSHRGIIIYCLLLRMINNMELQKVAITMRNGRKTGCQSRHLRYIIVPSFEQL